ncbi:MAG: hypothetical protein IPL65_17425 [Lewinellaceae bacterium]|nr:hypothetical protein [Lewinellaceae bacterium]
MQPSTHPRRRFLQLGLGATAGFLATGMGCNPTDYQKAAQNAANCTLTPEQTIGPFYPHVKNGDGDVDLTTIQGKEGQAQGQVIFVRGKILDENCAPIPNALVEIWQANHAGRYSHEGDSANPQPLDPNFEGWGEMATDAEGNYGFKTIKPAAYSFDDPTVIENWRTPHIHFKVSRRGYHDLITQLYFSGEKYLDTDTVLADLPEANRGQFILSPTTTDNGIPAFAFNLTLSKVATAAVRLATLDAYAGKYAMDLPFGTPKAPVTVHRDGEKLLLDIAGYTSVELNGTGKDEFDTPSISRRLVFNRDAQGAVGSVTVHSTSKAEPFTPFVAEKM